ncbi:MAG TPA: phosphotransferase [Thermoanaerobaculia bacterium]
MTTLPQQAVRYVDEWLGRGWTAEALAGDASVRAYYRIRSAGDETFIVAWYPDEVRDQLGQFLGAYEIVVSHAPVPEVIQHGPGVMLQRDAGDRTLFDVLHEERAEGLRLYRAAIDLLAGFQQAGVCNINPPFTAAFFFQELEMAREFYAEKLMGMDGAPLGPFLQKIAEVVSQHPYTLCHRDFHGQNIHVIGESLYLIDYQDLRMGPDTYDLASLLRDRGVARILGDATELELLENYRNATKRDEGVRRRYFEALLQRSIKILGTFARQPIDRGRLHYLEFIPATLESIRRCIDELPHWSELQKVFPLEFSLDAARERAEELNRGATG